MQQAKRTPAVRKGRKMLAVGCSETVSVREKDGAATASAAVTEQDALPRKESGGPFPLSLHHQPPG